MDIKENNRMRSVHFGSVHELVNLDHSLITNHRNKNYFIKIMTTHIPSNAKLDSWYGKNRESPKDIIRDALIGWEAGHKIAKGYAGNLNIDQKLIPYYQVDKKYKRKRIMSDFGDELDIHKVYQGNIELAWSKMDHERVDARHQLYTLMIDIGSRHYVDSMSTLWGAAAVYKISEYLISSGKSVKILIGSSCKNLVKGADRKITTTDIVVKNYNEPLALTRLTAMANAGFHRVFNFAARCCVDDTVRFDEMGTSLRTLKNSPPIQMENEIKLGHTKYVSLPIVDDKKGAEQIIVDAILETKEFAKAS